MNSCKNANNPYRILLNIKFTFSLSCSTRAKLFKNCSILSGCSLKHVCAATPPAIPSERLHHPHISHIL